VTHATLVFACVMKLVEGGSVGDARCATPEIQEIATAIQRESVEHDVKPGIVAAVMWHESRFKKYARGSKGEIGRMQILRGGAVVGKYRRMSFHALAQTDLNTHLGVAYMATYAHRCARASQWLTVYNRGTGTSRACRTSSYSAGVLSDLARGRHFARRIRSSSSVSKEYPEDLSPETEEECTHTSCKEQAILRTTETRTHALLPAGTRWGGDPEPSTSTGYEPEDLESRLAKLFEEP
jgi:Transglycosylase SLT domain